MSPSSRIATLSAAFQRPLAFVGCLLLSGCLFPEYTFDETAPSGGGGTGAGGATTASTNSATTSTGMGGEGGMAPVEDCFAPGDEDGDSLADCADPDCTADLECVDAIPVGWGVLGHMALYDGLATGDPACPEGTSAAAVYSGNASLSGATAQCSACGCQSPSWTGCDFNQDLDGSKAGRQGLYAGDKPCGGGAFTGGVTLTVPNPWVAPFTCSALDSSPGGQSCMGGACNQSVIAATAAPTGGSCVPTGGAPIMNTPGWNNAQKACRASSGLGGCDAAKTCVLKPKAPFESHVCIGRAGDQACPVGAYSQKISSYAGFSDTRDCTACTCGSGAGGSCALSIDLFSTSNCMSLIGTVSSNGCVNLSGNPTVSGRSATVSTPPTGGSCPSTGGGVPTGGVVETGPTTFCCLP